MIWSVMDDSERTEKEREVICGRSRQGTEECAELLGEVSRTVLG